MKRRGFLGFLGGAAVAGPGMVRSATAQGLEALSVGPALPISGPVPVAGLASAGANIASGDYNPLTWAKRDLARFLGRSAEEMMREKASITVSMLDPDLAAMRSMSLDAKVRIQRDRIHERSQHLQRHWLEQRIRDLMNPDAA